METKKLYQKQSDPAHIAKTILIELSIADAPNEKWLTDVTEFKYYVSTSTQDIYLSAILDLYDRRIVAYKSAITMTIRLLWTFFDAAVVVEPEAHPLFHSDRGFNTQKTAFRQNLRNIICSKDNQSGPLYRQWTYGRLLGNSKA